MQHSAMGTGWLTLWREDYMVFVYLLVAILGVGAAIFAVQNPDLVAVHFLSWRTVELPVSLIILLSAFVGIVAASISAFARSSGESGSSSAASRSSPPRRHRRPTSSRRPAGTVSFGPRHCHRHQSEEAIP